MKTKSAILYATTSKKIPLRSRYTLLMLRDGTPVSIRAEIVNDDVSGALDKAKPRRGEIVLNTIPLP